MTKMHRTLGSVHFYDWKDSPDVPDAFSIDRCGIKRYNLFIILKSFG